MSATYCNPVHPRSCPDPFVLKHAGEYFAFCTGVWHDGRAFGVLRSHDLVHWTELGGAIDLLPGGHTCYWAPEVAHLDGRFHLYYSVGNEERMAIRVGTADRPEGPYVDAGRALTSEEFAIDAHVFVDEDGTRWMFYATDFLSHTHVGTGTVRDRMLDPLTLEGHPRPVTRPRFDWQVYDPQRAEKGGVRWHTVEGPFVLRRKGLYYQMFSGGNWKNVTYGVSYATAGRLDAPGEWLQDCDGERVLPVLRTIPGRVVGPGHNSVVRGPDNRQLWCVYHRWDGGERVLAIDRLDWVGGRLVVLGPSTEPQPAPGRAIARPAGELRDLDLPGGDGLAEVTLRVQRAAKGGEVRVGLAAGAARAWDLAVPVRAAGDRLVRVEWSAGRVRSWVDGRRQPDGVCPVDPSALTLRVVGADVSLAACEVTPGWEDLFEEDTDDVASTGWSVHAGVAAGCRVVRGELVCDATGSRLVVSKGRPLQDHELVVNVRLHEVPAGRVEYGTASIRVVGEPAGAWSLRCDGVGSPLPPSFDPCVHHQIRLLREGRRRTVTLDGALLDTRDAPAEEEAAPVALHADGGIVAWEMVRVTALAPAARSADAVAFRLGEEAR